MQFSKIGISCDVRHVCQLCRGSVHILSHSFLTRLALTTLLRFSTCRGLKTFLVLLPRYALKQFLYFVLFCS